MMFRCATFSLSLALCLSASIAPSQVKPWTPPKTTIAKELVEVGQFLLEHGMADPRGGKFAIEWRTFKAQPGGKDVEYCLLGWLVDRGGDKTIVDLRGFEGKVQGRLEPFQVHAAVDKALAISDQGTGYNTSRGYSGGIIPLLSKDRLNDACTSLLNDRAVILLLIHGDVSEAERLFKRRTYVVSDQGIPKTLPGAPPVAGLRILEGYLDSVWYRACEYYEKGDDKMAAEVFKTLAQNRDAYEEFAAKQPGQQPRTLPQTHFGFLEYAPVLLKDSERRLQEGVKKIDMAEIKNLAQPERIARLITLMDEVRSFGASFFERDPATDPIIAALIAEDSAAGDALLDCAQRDKRLTRSSQSFYGYQRPPSQSVRSAALFTFNQIAKFGPNSDYGTTPQTVDELRTKWSRYKLLSPSERWLENLKDDQTMPYDWVQSAESLTLSNHYGRTTSSPKVTAPFSSLKSEQQSELLELCLSRSKQLENQKFGPWQERFRNHDLALRILLAARRLDARKTLPRMDEIAKVILKENPVDLSARTGVMSSLPEAFDCLIGASYPKSADNYLNWLKGIGLQHIYSRGLFTPLLNLKPTVADRFVKEMLTDPKSGLCINDQSILKRQREIGNLLQSPLIQIGSFREVYSGLLKRTDRIGDALVGEGFSAVTINGNTEWSNGNSVPLQSARKIAVRVCDYYASRIKFDGAPEFQIDWSVDKKDAAIQSLAVFLKDHWKDIAEDTQKRSLY